MKTKLLFAILIGLIGLSHKAYAQAPSISAFVPNSGPVGSTVTITGTNFNTTPTNNVVFFGAMQATVSAATATQLSVNVPTGATHDYITVLNTTTGLLAYTFTKFTPTYTPNSGNITASDFTDAGNYIAGDQPFSQERGDFDGDGKTDLVVVNLASASISVFRNTSTLGTISFAPKVDFELEPYFIALGRYIAIGDLDGDGKLDIAVTNRSLKTVSVFRNTSSVGTISFAAKIDYNTDPSNLSNRFIAMGDLDGDGKLEIAVGSSGDTMTILQNTSTVGTIGFAPYVSFMAGARHFSIDIGDLDNDGKPDIVLANDFGPTLTILRNTSTLGVLDFTVSLNYSPLQYIGDVSMSDIDGDGKLDLALSSWELNGIAILRNTGSGVGDISFNDITNITTNANMGTISLGDLDGDGKPDIVTVDTGYDDIFIYRNTSTLGAISYADNVIIYLTGSPYDINIADLDGDGRPDLSYSNVLFDRIYVLKNSPVALSVSDFNTSSTFTVYPNPTNSKVFIRSSEPHIITQIEIIDISGRVLQYIKSDSYNEISIDVSHLSAGNYIIKLQSEKGTAFKEFIKM